MLTEPVEQLLESSSTVLLSGAGGGFDVIGAVPLLVELRRRGKKVHLGSLTFTAVASLEGATPVPDVPALYRVAAAAASETLYCPEAWLAAWLAQRGWAAPEVWCLQKTGVLPLRKAYAHLIEELGVDTVILIDGGIDAILRGDEESLGTPGGDLTSLAAVNGICDIGSMLACVGFGSELRDGVSHSQALESISRLSRSGGYLGCASLLPRTESGKAYLEALEFVFSHQVRRSHVHSVVRAALMGEFGSAGPDTWLSPLSSIFWFFSLRAVAESHLFLGRLEGTQTLWEVNSLIEGIRKGMQVSKSRSIPL